MLAEGGLVGLDGIHSLLAGTSTQAAHGKPHKGNVGCKTDALKLGYSTGGRRGCVYVGEIRFFLEMEIRTSLQNSRRCGKREVSSAALDVLQGGVEERKGSSCKEATTAD